jgi:hypothetical protein
MTHRSFPRNVVLTVAGALIGAGALMWSAGDSEIEIPTRPDAVTVEAAVSPAPEEALPAIRVPGLKPPASAAVRVPPRPTLVLADLSVEAFVEPLPGIAVPALHPPCSVRPRTAVV